MTDDDDTPVSSALGQELQAATYPHALEGKFLQARDTHGAWSQEARAALANELRAGAVDGVIAALEDRR